jgi:hypothetical protein
MSACSGLRHVHVYFAARGFAIREPEFPLVAVVFPDREKFAEYCRSEKVNPAAGLMGYYLQSSNRVALYDTASTGDLDGTIIHEAVHQVAFNLGLHRRIGDNPLWVVEGLATTFEPENFRSPLPSTPAAAKITGTVAAVQITWRAVGREIAQNFVNSDQLFQSRRWTLRRAWALRSFCCRRVRSSTPLSGNRSPADRSGTACAPSAGRLPAGVRGRTSRSWKSISCGIIRVEVALMAAGRRRSKQAALLASGW